MGLNSHNNFLEPDVFSAQRIQPVLMSLLPNLGLNAGRLDNATKVINIYFPKRFFKNIVALTVVGSFSSLNIPIN